MLDRPASVAFCRRPVLIGRDDGEFLGTVLLFLSFISLFVLCFYGALYYHAYSVVNAAAQDGLRSAQLYGNDLEDGVDAAENILLLVQLTETSIEIEESDSLINVKVTGRIASPVFGWSAAVAGEASGPRERYIATVEERPGYAGE